MAAASKCKWLDEYTAEEYCFRRLHDEEKVRVDDHLRTFPACREWTELIRRQIAELRLVLSLHAKLYQDERRKSPRLPAAGPVQIAIRKGSRRLLVSGELRDQSHHGLGLRAMHPCQIGERVEVRRGDSKHLAIVRHCRRKGSTYLVGLELVAA